MRTVRLTLHLTSDQGDDELYDGDVEQMLAAVIDHQGVVERAWELPGGQLLRLKCAAHDTP